MTHILIGSETSPFVRRIRILMEHIPYEFKKIDVFQKEDGAFLNSINPINQIPVLIDGKQVIWDSRFIAQYLNQKYGLYQENWDDINFQTAIDGAMNAAVSLLLMKRSEINIEQDLMYINRQKERIESVLNYCSDYFKGRGLKEWNFATISLVCFLDWGLFRELFTISHRPEAQVFLQHYRNKDIIKKTSLPKG